MELIILSMRITILIFRRKENRNLNGEIKYVTVLFNVPSQKIYDG